MTHFLRRCVFIEIGAVSILKDADLDFTDEICEQLYFDSFGMGINGEFAAPLRNKVEG